MKEINNEQLKEIQLNILNEFHNFCKEYGINYSLAGGTLLGAIRHKGFIPWDNDIDVMMLRQDYEKFLVLAERKFKYKVMNPYKNRPYPYTYTKIMDDNTILHEYAGNCENVYSVYIDVFPIDYLPNDEKKLKKFFSYIKSRIVIFYGVNYYKITNFKHLSFVNKIKKILMNFCYFFGLDKKIYKKIDLKAKSINKENTNLIGCIIAGYGKKEVLDKCVYNNYIDVDFEGYRFKALKGYDEYLTSLYGDYMTPPPIDKRVQPHNFKAYFKESL